MEKLVRDIVPAVTVCDPEDDGTRFRVATDSERDAFLLAKLGEEVHNLEESGTIESLADLMEVVGAVMLRKGWKNDDLSAAREKRRKEMGGYTRYFVMMPNVVQ